MQRARRNPKTLERRMRVRGVTHLGGFLALLAALAVAGCAALDGARLYREGTAALDRGDAPAAVATLERAARLVPRASEVHNHLGLAYRAAERRDEARRAFERALALDCDNDAARRNLRALRPTEELPDAP